MTALTLKSNLLFANFLVFLSFCTVAVAVAVAAKEERCLNCQKCMMSGTN